MWNLYTYKPNAIIKRAEKGRKGKIFGATRILQISESIKKKGKKRRNTATLIMGINFKHNTKESGIVSIWDSQSSAYDEWYYLRHGAALIISYNDYPKVAEKPRRG